MIHNADYIIDMGPGGGEQGGRIVAAGTPQQKKLKMSTRSVRHLFASLRVVSGRGDIIEYSSLGSVNDGNPCEVSGDREARYQDKTWSLSALAQLLTGCQFPVAGPL